MKRLIIEKDPSVKPDHIWIRNWFGSPLAWFAFGMLILYATLAALKYTTLVPKSNFWVKESDCLENDRHCSYQDVTCGNRDLYHKCTDSKEQFRFYTYFVEKAG